MSEVLKDHLARFVKLEEDKFEKIISFFQVKEVRKKENLLVAGQVCRSNYFVLEGCLRKFFINEKGVEQTTDFAIETWWMTDTYAFDRQLPAEINLQAVEHSTLLQIDYTGFEQLVQQHPEMERYFRVVYQRAYAAAERRIRLLYEHSGEELYLLFNKQFPEFVQRIPQYLLASFLGFTPEYLSQIRSKKRS